LAKHSSKACVIEKVRGKAEEEPLGRGKGRGDMEPAAGESRRKKRANGDEKETDEVEPRKRIPMRSEETGGRSYLPHLGAYFRRNFTLVSFWNPCRRVPGFVLKELLIYSSSC
jgi:hypothetical protein